MRNGNHEQELRDELRDDMPIGDKAQVDFRENIIYPEVVLRLLNELDRGAESKRAQQDKILKYSLKGFVFLLAVSTFMLSISFIALLFGRFDIDEFAILAGIFGGGAFGSCTLLALITFISKKLFTYDDTIPTWFKNFVQHKQ